MVVCCLVVFQRLGDIDGGRQVSSLRSVRSMLGRVYPNLGGEQDGVTEEERGEPPGRDMAPLLAAGYVVDLVEPCVAHIHQQFTRNMVHTHPHLSLLFTSSNTNICAGSTGDLLVPSTERVCGAVSSVVLCM